jgi:hypothetical protein
MSLIQIAGRNITDMAVLGGFAAYFLVSVLIRVLISGTAEMDETEQLIHTQTLQLGYGAQLPLYTWLQFLSFKLFGINIFALTILKHTLLYSTFVCVYKIARQTLRDSMGAALATFSLFLVPQIVWESYRTLTNTVLVTLLAAATLLVILRLYENPTKGNYALLGTAAGLGMLSKYNFAIFLAALIFAALTTPVFKERLLCARAFLSLGIMALIAVPPYIWILTNLDRATSSAKKLKALGGTSPLTDMAWGFVSLLGAWVGYFWPALLAYGLFVCFFKPVRKTDPDAVIHQLLKRTLIITFVLCSFMVVLFRVTYFKERWMQPLLFFLPVFFMHYLASRLNKKRFKALIGATLLPAALAMLLFPGSVLLASKADRVTRLSPPYRAMAARIEDEGFSKGIIITNDHRIGGNFRLHFRQSPVLVTRMLKSPFDADDPALIVWNADRNDLPPEELSDLAQQLLKVPLDKSMIRYVEEPMLYWKERKMKLGYVVIAGQ